MRTPVLNFIAEILLWISANVVCVVLPTAAVYFLGTNVAGWGPAKLSFFVTSAALISLTWGSWASLIWTRTRALRVGMRGSTVIPGVLTIAFGVFGAYVGIGKLIVWLGVILSGLAMIVVALGLSRAIGAAAAPKRRIGMVLGGVAFPVVTTIIALGAGMLWYQFVSHPFDGDWRNLISAATAMVTLLGVSLTSTVVPAVLSGFFQRAGQIVCDRC